MVFIYLYMLISVVCSCNNSCPALHFGHNCSSVCDCGDRIQCNPVTGVCPSSMSFLPSFLPFVHPAPITVGAITSHHICVFVRYQRLCTRWCPGSFAPAAPCCALLLFVLWRSPCWWQRQVCTSMFFLNPHINIIYSATLQSMIRECGSTEVTIPAWNSNHWFLELQRLRRGFWTSVSQGSGGWRRLVGSDEISRLQRLG